MKVLRILASLEKEEWHWLAKFVASAAHNRHPEVIRLFEILKKRKTDAATTTDSICQQLLGAAGAAEKTRFHHLSNYLLQTVEDFLVWWELQKAEMETDFSYYLLKSLQKRGLDDLFISNLERFENRKSVQKRRDAAYFRTDYVFRYEDFKHFVRTERGKKVDLQAISNALETAFLAEKLRLACATKSIKAVQTHDLDDGMLLAAIQFLDKNEAAQKAPAVEPYYFGIKMMLENEADLYYFRLKTSFSANQPFYELLEQREILMMLINYCLRKKNFGDGLFDRELNDWYRIGFDSELFIENGELSRFTYFNAAAASILVEDFEFAENFIEKYRSFLPEPQREGAYNYIKGRLFYAKKDYPNAQRFLLRADHDDPLMNIAVNSLLLKCYFEDGEWGVLQNHFDNFSAWLRRQKKLGYQKDNAVNLIKLARKLLSLAPSDSAGREKLRAEVLAAKPLSEKEWFLNQIERKR